MRCVFPILPPSLSIPPLPFELSAAFLPAGDRRGEAGALGMRRRCHRVGRRCCRATRATVVHSRSSRARLPAHPLSRADVVRHLSVAHRPLYAPIPPSLPVWPAVAHVHIVCLPLEVAARQRGSICGRIGVGRATEGRWPAMTNLSERRRRAKCCGFLCK